MFLTDAPEGIPLILCGNSGGKRINKYLSGLGLASGIEVELMRGSAAGPVVLRVGENKLVLGRGIASKIEVEYKI